MASSVVTDHTDDSETEDEPSNETEKEYLSKTELEAIIKGKSTENLVFVQNDKYKSGVWQKFRIILYKGVKQQYVKCRWCSSVLSYKSKTGTASLLRHRCMYPSRKKKFKTIYTTLESPPRREIAEGTRAELARAQLKFISKERCYGCSMDSDEFQKMGQILIDLGCEYGKREVDDVVMPTSYFVDTLMPLKLRLIKDEIKTLLIDSDLALSVEIWRDEFIILYGRLIHYNFDLKSFVLGARRYEEGKAKELIIDILKEYMSDPEKELNNCFIVLDGVLYEKEDFVNLNRVYCTGYCLNKIIKGVLTAMPYDMRPNISDYDLETMDSTEKEALLIYMEISDTFKKCRESLNEQRVTINDVYLWKKKLQISCSESAGDTPQVKEVKKKAMDLIRDSFKIDEIHAITVFLNPVFKGLKRFTFAERTEVHELVQKYMNEIKATNSFIEKRKNVGKIKLNITSDQLRNFTDFIETPNHIDDKEPADEELNRYIFMKEELQDDVLEFWKTHPEFPHLRALAKRFLSVPACATYPNERKKEEDPKRGDLSLEDLNSYYFLNKNLALIE